MKIKNGQERLKSTPQYRAKTKVNSIGFVKDTEVKRCVFTLI